MKIDKRQKWLKEITKRITMQVKPKKVILFGSFAHGKPKRFSDIDLFIICDYPTDKKKRYNLVDMAIGKHIFPVDIIIRNSSEISRRLKIGDIFISEIMSRGKVLYESSVH